jgi:hypothetical protein
MAAIVWPDGLRGPLVSGYSREEIVGFRENDLASGPAFVEVFSEDTPQFHNITYQFKNGDARRFQLWLRENKIKSYSPWFDGPLITEDRSVLAQECRYTSDGYPQLQSKTNNGIHTYTARIITREIINNDDAYATELEALWGVNCGDIDLGGSLLDEGLNG